MGNIRFRSTGNNSLCGTPAIFALLDDSGIDHERYFEVELLIATKKTRKCDLARSLRVPFLSESKSGRLDQKFTLGWVGGWYALGF